MSQPPTPAALTASDDSVQTPATADRVALISCGKNKLAVRAAARDLYTSNLFKLSVRYAELTCTRWYVISALHGLVAPDDVLAPYDFSLTSMRKDDRESWARRTFTQLHDRGERGIHVTLLAGGPYSLLAGLARWSNRDGVNFYPGLITAVDEPLVGKGIGQRLSWLKAQIGEHQAAKETP